MHHPILSRPTAIAGLVAALGMSALSLLGQDIPANLSVSGPVSGAGGRLNGEFWKRPTASILVDGASVRAHGIDNQIHGFGAPDGTFRATTFNYTGNDLTPVVAWLMGDSGSYAGLATNLDDGAFRMRGFINVPVAGSLNIGTSSDDGSRITIGGIDIINNDNSHGGATVDSTVNFLAAGLY